MGGLGLAHWEPESWISDIGSRISDLGVGLCARVVVWVDLGWLIRSWDLGRRICDLGVWLCVSVVCGCIWVGSSGAGILCGICSGRAAVLCVCVCVVCGCIWVGSSGVGSWELGAVIWLRDFLPCRAHNCSPRHRTTVGTTRGAFP